MKFRKGKDKLPANWVLTAEGHVQIGMSLNDPDRVVISQFYAPALGTFTVPEEACKAISDNNVAGTYECYFRLDGTLVRIEGPKKSKKKVWEIEEVVH